jgi:diamine N-acetyltransferase
VPAPDAIALRPTRESDLDFVLALERDPESTPFVGQWSRDEHREAIARADRDHRLVVEGPEETPVGYLIAFDLVREGCGVYVKRIVAARKSGGIGRHALRAFADSAFAERAAPYLWLNVHRENLRGQRCYRAIGFVEFEPGAPELARHDHEAGNSASGRALPMIRQRDAFERSC